MRLHHALVLLVLGCAPGGAEVGRKTTTPGTGSGQTTDEPSATATGGGTGTGTGSSTGTGTGAATTGTGTGATATGTGTGSVVDLSNGRCDFFVNPGAERGDTTGWTVASGDLIAVQHAADRPVPFEGGWAFAAGDTPSSFAFQSVDLSEVLPAIQQGGVTAHVTVQARSWSGSDRVSIGMTARDASGAELASVLVGPWTDDFWRERRAHLELPPGTEHLEAGLYAERRRGTANDVYTDAWELCLDTTPPPAATDVVRGPWLSWVTPTAVSVLWETAGDVLGAVEVGEGRTLGTVVREAAASDHHEVRIEGLTPDTSYLYRVSSGGSPGEMYSLRTAPTANVPFEFVVWGDNQDGPDRFAQLVDRMEGLHPEFALAVGDIVQSGTERNYDDQFLDPAFELLVETPVLVAAGNHERYSDGDASLFDLHLAQPGDEHCFTWTYGGAWFLFLDTELAVDSGAQLTCIEEALASPEFAAADVQIALFHYPPRIEYWAFWIFDDLEPYDGDEEVRDVLEPMFHEAGVDLVFNGHNHLYAWTPPGTYSDVAWITTGGGGGDIDTSNWVVGDWGGIEVTEFEHHFMHVSIDDKTIDFTAYDMEGRRLHAASVLAD